jgi:hypothetical protein
MALAIEKPRCRLALLEKQNSDAREFGSRLSSNQTVPRAAP